ncbi:MAG: hypothetical protein PHC53_04400 [Patescibacteria group bacterium]|nr:hypothetical protein [Patescibacteria group bacterium]
MDKKTTTIVIIVVAVLIVCGGAYYGYYRWQQQRLVSQVFKEMYGVDLSKVSGQTGIQGKVAEEIAKEMAKEEVAQKQEEAREAAKTPEDRYNETQSVTAYDDASKGVSSEAQGIVEKVFGKAKLVGYSSGFYGGANKDSGVTTFKIARLTTGADVGAVSKAFSDQGLQILNSGVEDQQAMVMAGNDNVQYIVGFNLNEQDVNVSIMRAAPTTE